MRRLLTLLLICVLSVSNAAGIAAATCRHDNAGAHASALVSSDISVAVAAAQEETAARTTGKEGALADTAAASLTSVIIPSNVLACLVQARDSADLYLATSPSLSGRSLLPLLEPPLA